MCERLSISIDAVMEMQQFLLKGLGVGHLNTLAVIGSVFHSLDFNRCWEMPQKRGRELDAHSRFFSQESQLLKIIAQIREIRPGENSSRPAVVGEHGGDGRIRHVVGPEGREYRFIRTAEDTAQSVDVVDHTTEEDIEI